MFCRMVKKEQDLAVESSQPVEHKDYSLKAGQKIQINLGVSPYQSMNHFQCCLLSPEKGLTEGSRR